jgi:hypothetical protein
LVVWHNLFKGCLVVWLFGTTFFKGCIYMDNNDKSITFINKLYDKLGYYDLYGNSVIIFIVITLFVFLVYSYCKVMQTRQSIADDWINQRCKPQNIPFAGYITKPEGKTEFEYTGENFQYCVQNILVNITGYALAPFQYMISSLTNIFSMLSDSIDKIREFVNLIRNSIQHFTEDVFQRIFNVMIPIQQIFISLIDTFNKIQGVMTAGLYTMLGSYYTLKSLMGAILELIIKVLITIVVIVVGLWILPFTWPAAAVTTVVFLSIAIPLSIIIFFMTEILHIQTSGIPKLRCFDKNTTVILNDLSTKHIEELRPGDILQNNVTIMSTIKVTSNNLNMYNLNGIIVSESHIVNYNESWIPIREHPDACLINNYIEPYLYCLNTSTKTIVLNGITFTDWDEIYGDNLLTVLKYKSIHSTKNINPTLDKGLHKNTIINLLHSKKSISQINIGDILSTRGIVYGIVELHKPNLGIINNGEKLYHLLVSNKYFESGTKKYNDYNYTIDSIIDN